MVVVVVVVGAREARLGSRGRKVVESGAEKKQGGIQEESKMTRMGTLKKHDGGGKFG